MTKVNTEVQTCGIVMPISGIEGCGESHWAEVLSILTDAIEDAGLEGNLVSNSDDVGIIHKRIIQNLHDNPIVVCDVSCKNPNVMFELGLRLAFDKPTIIVKDSETSYSFDTSAIEHLEYPRDLRFNKIVEFKEKLADKISATLKKATTDPNYTTFLKHFGEFTVAKLDKKEISGQEYILEELKSLRKSMYRLERNNSLKRKEINRTDHDIDICLGHNSGNNTSEKFKTLVSHPSLEHVGIEQLSQDHFHFVASVKEGSSVSIVNSELRDMLDSYGRRNVSGKRENNPKTLHDNI
jgi:hypothetical protein